MDISCFSVFCLCVFVSLLTVVIGQDPPCTGRDQCSCVTADGKVIDLSSVGNSDGSSKFTDLQAPDGYMYSYNPCYPFTELACVDQSVCQVPTDRSTSYPAGDASSPVFTNDGLNNIITYTSTDSMGTTRTTQVTLICDPNAADANLTPLGEQGSSIYYLTLSTKCACPDGCSNNPPPTDPGPGPGPGPSGEDGGISIGTILCIVALSLSFVYFVGGMLFLKFGRQASGAAIIPNGSFWASVPGNVKNGFQYTYCKIRGKEFTRTYSAV